MINSHVIQKWCVLSKCVVISFIYKRTSIQVIWFFSHIIFILFQFFPPSYVYFDVSFIESLHVYLILMCGPLDNRSRENEPTKNIFVNYVVLTPDSFHFYLLIVIQEDCSEMQIHLIISRNAPPTTMESKVFRNIVSTLTRRHCSHCFSWLIQKRCHLF